jgi:hypothetical protein
MDAGSLTSVYTNLAIYNYALDAFTFTADSVANSMTTGLIYRFIFRSINAIGYSPFSDSVRIALGPLPS